MRTRLLTRVLNHLLGAALAAAAIGLRWLLEPMLQGYMPQATVFAAVAVTVWIGGYGPAVVAALVGHTGSALLFADSGSVPALTHASGVVGFMVSALVSAIIIAAGGQSRTARLDL